ncbi:MAG: hypothetical protein IIU00_00865 [Clostridia bacterium]|nr:hypothetical protein [Clostridia bacterium]
MRVRIEIDGALVGLKRVDKSVSQCVDDYGRTAASAMEQYAKANRPWIDRTGNARRTMEGQSERTGQVVSMGVAGHMPYSVFLELDYGQKYAILYPTVQTLAPQVLNGLAAGIAQLK